MDDYENACEPCRDGEHEQCTGDGCMCIDMEHDDEYVAEDKRYISEFGPQS